MGNKVVGVGADGLLVGLADHMSASVNWVPQDRIDSGCAPRVIVHVRVFSCFKPGNWYFALHQVLGNPHCPHAIESKIIDCPNDRSRLRVNNQMAVIVRVSTPI